MLPAITASERALEPGSCRLLIMVVVLMEKVADRGLPLAEQDDVEIGACSEFARDCSLAKPRCRSGRLG